MSRPEFIPLRRYLARLLWVLPVVRSVLWCLSLCLCDICIFIGMVERSAGVLWQIKSQVSFFHRIGCQTPPFPPQSTISRKHLLCVLFGFRIDRQIQCLEGSTFAPVISKGWVMGKKNPVGSTWSSKPSFRFIWMRFSSFPFSGYRVGTALRFRKWTRSRNKI